MSYPFKIIASTKEKNSMYQEKKTLLELKSISVGIVTIVRVNRAAFFLRSQGLNKPASTFFDGNLSSQSPALVFHLFHLPNFRQVFKLFKSIRVMSVINSECAYTAYIDRRAGYSKSWC